MQTVKAMAEVKVVRRWSRARGGNGSPGNAGRAGASAPVAATEGRAVGSDGTRAGNGAAIRLVAVGASTGGPLVLQTLLAGLPRDIAAPVVVVQHIAAGFLPGLATWLSGTTGFPVRIAEQGESPLHGHAYLAPDGCAPARPARRRIVLGHDEPDGGLRPAVSRLFASVAEAYGPAPPASC